MPKKTASARPAKKATFQITAPKTSPTAMGQIFGGPFGAAQCTFFKIGRGQKFRIEATKDPTSQGGWSNGGGVYFGPEGSSGPNDANFATSAYVPALPLGMLIGGFDPINRDGQTLTYGLLRRVFSPLAFAIGRGYEGISPIDGYLYIVMNDTFTLADNKGTITVIITYL